MREERKMSFKKTVYKRKSRTGLDGKFVTINLELTDDMLLIERVYPNVIDLCSDLGGIIKVLVFLCIATGMMHNQILFDKYLLETIFSGESIEKDGNSDNKISS